MEDKMIERDVTWTITKYKKDQYPSKSYAVNEIKGNLLLNVGIQQVWELVCGDAVTPFSSEYAHLVVGDSDTAASATQTGPQALVNFLYKEMDTGFPEYGDGQVATWQSVFQWNEANFAWNEFLVANGSDSTAVCLNRKVSAQGTKTEDEVWVLRLDITLG